jgi:hypothetical protein
MSRKPTGPGRGGNAIEIVFTAISFQSSTASARAICDQLSAARVIRGGCGDRNQPMIPAYAGHGDLRESGPYSQRCRKSHWTEKSAFAHPRHSFASTAQARATPIEAKCRKWARLPTIIGRVVVGQERSARHGQRCASPMRRVYHQAEILAHCPERHRDVAVALVQTIGVSAPRHNTCEHVCEAPMADSGRPSVAVW